MLPAEGQPTEIRSVKVPDAGITVDLLYLGP
jgi:hypothetical protein